MPNSFFLTDRYGRKNLPIPFETIIEVIKDSLILEDESTPFINRFAEKFKANANQNHHLLVHLLKIGLIDFIVTTNFDTCIEEAYKDLTNAELPRIVGYSESKNSLNNMSSLKGKLIKLHGSRDIPETLGTTVTQITDNEFASKTNILLEKIFSLNNCDLRVDKGSNPFLSAPRKRKVTGS